MDPSSVAWKLESSQNSILLHWTLWHSNLGGLQTQSTGIDLKVLGCVIPASWLPLAAGSEFTQPKAHLLADPCRCPSHCSCFKKGALVLRGEREERRLSSSGTAGSKAAERRWTDEFRAKCLRPPRPIFPRQSSQPQISSSTVLYFEQVSTKLRWKLQKGEIAVTNS